MNAPAHVAPTFIGQYAIEREIARGRAAVVYLARDRKHERQVAVKILNSNFGAVLGAERFVAEISVTARLQHPNIVPLFESGEDNGRLFYVMPYIEGESLRARLVRHGQLPIPEAVRITLAVASALDYAHSQGVVHRDLKPENILLQHGHPIVADFGIALALSRALDDRITQTGISLGTPQYMSPEQAAGDRSLDHRTDIYSLGVVLYEMLTGDPSHLASSAQSLVAKLLFDPVPSIRTARPGVPDYVEAAVMRALEKRPADRWQSVAEFADALSTRSAVSIPQGVATPGMITTGRLTGATTAAALAVPRVAWWRRAWPMVAVAAGAAGAALAISRATSSPPPSLSVNITPPTHHGVPLAIVDFAVSPDGRTLAMVARSDSVSRVYLRRLTNADAEASVVDGSDGAAFAAFSPNGKWIAVTSANGKLLRFRVDSAAAPSTLADHVDFNGGLAWAGDDAIILGTNLGGLLRVPTTGGAPRVVTKPAPAWGHGFPLVAPDGRTIFFTDWGPGYTEDDFLAIGSLETGAYRRTPLIVDRALGVVDGRVVYVVGGSIFAVRYDAQQMRVVGDPVRIAENLAADIWRSAALSSGGALMYRRGVVTQRIVALDESGWLQPLSGDDMSIWSGARFSPGGDRIALDAWKMTADTSRSDIWVMDVKTRALTRVTQQGDVTEPAWTPDGRQLLFTTWFEERPALWLQPVDAPTPATMLFRAPEGDDVFAATATPDGRGALFCQGRRYSTAPRTQLLYITFGSALERERLVDEPIGADCGGSVSPDGRWLAYVALDAGEPRVYVKPFRRNGRRVEVSDGNGVRPAWSRDGTRVYYAHSQSYDDRRLVMAARVAPGANSVDVTSREPLGVLLKTDAYDVAPDGRHIVTVEQSDRRVQLIVNTNWLPLLRARLAGRR